jgi:UDP-N-acetylglucosamine 2-epimerase (non-hydrolysing)
MKTVVIVYGTRPEAIKLAPVVVELKKIQSIRTVLICSGQHKEMLEGIMELWDLTPDITLKYDFKLGHTSAIPGIMIELEQEFLKVVPDFVVVQGDTATATAAALQAHALRIPVGHIEAGLRSGDLWNPWPEEANRRIIDAMASLHFAPTEYSAKNLELEGHGSTTTVTGNTIVDALIHSSTILDSQPEIRRDLETLLGFSFEEDFILFTQHRREGFAGGQTQVFKAILDLAKRGFKIVFPVHLNPLVQDKVNEMLLGKNGVYLIPPQGYLTFLELLKNCNLIVSDSGGIQEEAPTFGKRILITRLTTERPEVIDSGYGSLVGYDSELIVSMASSIVGGPSANILESSPFGNGDSAVVISGSISVFLSDAHED